jgi:glycosyltransferase involved in cell wall biosynthesis
MKHRSAQPDAPRSVLFLLPTLRGGGAERVIITLLQHLDRGRFRPTLAVVDMSDAVYRADVPADVELIDLHSSRVRYALPRIIRLIWSMRPDVVFSTLGHLNLALAILRPLMPNDPRYFARETNLVSRVNAAYHRPRLWNWAYRRFYSRFDLVVCQSRAMRDDLVDHHGFPPGKSIIINNPVDTSRIRRLSGDAATNPGTGEPRDGATIRLLAVGRFSNEKGFDLLIEALALCERPNLQLTILGEGPLRGDMERLARDKGVRGQIVFAGFQANPYPYFREADALVLSSRYEGFPNVVLEALACGTPIVSTPAPGIAEIIGGVAGCLLADTISAESLARELRRFVKGARVSPEAVRPYEVETIVRRYEAALA